MVQIKRGPFKEKKSVGSPEIWVEVGEGSSVFILHGMKDLIDSIRTRKIMWLNKHSWK